LNKKTVLSLLPNFNKYKFIYFLPPKIRTSKYSQDKFFLMPDYCEEEFQYITNIIALSNTKYILFIEITKETVFDMGDRSFYVNSKKAYFHHFALSSSPLNSNINFFEKAKHDNYFIFSRREVMYKVFNSTKISIKNISVLPNFLKESKNCKFDTLFISFIRNQFRPVISYNDLIGNFSKINLDNFLNIC